MELSEDGVDRTAHARLGRLTLALGWVPIVVLLPLAAVTSSIPPVYRYLPLAASAVLFGMPHGAVDYVALPRARSGRVTPRGVTAVVVLYLLLGGGYLIAWFLAPVPAAVGFVLLTWFHWGQGDLYALRDLLAVDHVDDAVQQGLTVLVRGGLPMLVPLLGFPERYRSVVETFVVPFGGTVSAWPVFDPAFRLGLGVAFAAVTLVALARGWRRATDRRGWRLDAAETGLLWALFLFVSPILAVGVYFCLWHSVRHIARVVLLDERSVESIVSGRWLPSIGRFAIEAAVPTLAALGLVGALWVLAPSPTGTLPALTGLYLVGIAVLTLPHTAVVLLLDREQGVWTLSTASPNG